MSIVTQNLIQTSYTIVSLYDSYSNSIPLNKTNPKKNNNNNIKKILQNLYKQNNFRQSHFEF